MHLSPVAIEGTIRLLNQPHALGFGDIVETAERCPIQLRGLLAA
jgi:hypothetical protein